MEPRPFVIPPATASAPESPEDARAFEAIIATVIVPAHNAEGTIADQLHALATQVDPPSFEVIVVANRCTDSTIDVARQFTDRLDLTIVVADDRASAAHARNVGAERARGRVFLFCDADDVVGINWIAGMVEPLESGHADFVGGLVLTDRSQSPRWMSRNVDNRASRPQCLIGKVLPYALGATLGVDAEAFRAVGGYDPAFPGGGAEEQDLQFRLYRSGYRIGEAPSATLRYSLRTTYAGLLSQQRAYGLGAKVLSAKEDRLQLPSLAGTIRKIVRRWRAGLKSPRNAHLTFFVFIAHLNVMQWWDHRKFVRSQPPAGDKAKMDFVDFCAPLATPAIGGLGFAATDSKSAAFLATAAGIEVDTIALLSHLLPTGGSVVDVGAHVGTFAVAAAALGGPTAIVAAFEPASRARHMLGINADRHRVREQITIHPVAVGERTDRQSFSIFSNGLVSGFETKNSVPDAGTLLERVDVDVVRLDDIIRTPVDVLKIDVEGFEIDVLRGAVHLIDTSPNIAVIMEVNPGALRRAGHAPKDLLSFFPGASWDLYLVDEFARFTDAAAADRLAVRLEADMIEQRSGRTGWYANVVAVRAGRPLHTART